MQTINLNLLEKAIRSQVIRAHMKKQGITKAVCFTCGNSAKYLKRIGVDVLAIGDGQDLKPKTWWTRARIRKHFPNHFNATSGDLSPQLMFEIGMRLRRALGKDRKIRKVKVGSGETIITLAYAFPEQFEQFEPYRDGTSATKYEKGATLNYLVEDLWGKTSTWTKNPRGEKNVKLADKDQWNQAKRKN